MLTLPHPKNEKRAQKPHFGLILWRIPPSPPPHPRKKNMSLHAVVTSYKTPEKVPSSKQNFPPKKSFRLILRLCYSDLMQKIRKTS